MVFFFQSQLYILRFIDIMERKKKLERTFIFVVVFFSVTLLTVQCTVIRVWTFQNVLHELHFRHYNI